MNFISDFKVKDIVKYKGVKAEITKVDPPHELCIRNLEFPKGEWKTSRLPYTEVQKINE